MSYYSCKWDEFFQQITVYTEVTAHCNNKCVFCPIDKLSRVGFIKKEVRDRVVQFLSSHPDIKFKTFFHQLGEPLLYKDLESYISLLAPLPNVDMWMATNGVLLTPQKLESLYLAGLRNIWYSMFYTNEEDYSKNTQTNNFITSRDNLNYLLSKSNLFKRIHIVSFSSKADEIQQDISNKKNISIETGRRIREWRFDKIYSFIAKMVFAYFSKIDPRKYICISVNGDLTYHWRDYNFLNSIGNICELNDEDILKGFISSSFFLKVKKLFPFNLNGLSKDINNEFSF